MDDSTSASDDTRDAINCVFIHRVGCSMETEFRVKDGELIVFKGVKPISSHIMAPYSN